MAKKPDITTIASGYYSRQALNNNFENLRDKFDNTLSLDGSTPNAMGADLDMNSNDILNASLVDTDALKINGTLVGVGDLSAAGATLSSISHTGNGSTVAFSTGYQAFITDNTQVYIDGVYQNKAGYSISGTTLTFSEAPPLNAAIEIVVARTLDFGADDAANVNYNQGGTGAVNRTVLTKLQETVSVKDFGAVGDGVTDDTEAIQAAIDSGSAHVVVPTGTYRVDGTISLRTRSALRIDGILSRLSAYSASTRPIILVNNVQLAKVYGRGSLTTQNASIDGLICIGPEDPSVSGNQSIDVQWCTVEGLSLTGGGLTSTNLGVTIQCTAAYGGANVCYQNLIQDIVINNVGQGIYIGAQANANMLTNLNMWNIGVHGINLAGDDGSPSSYPTSSITDNLISGLFISNSYALTTSLRCVQASFNIFNNMHGEPGNGRLFSFDANSESNTLIGIENHPQAGTDAGTNNTILTNVNVSNAGPKFLAYLPASAANATGDGTVVSINFSTELFDLWPNGAFSAGVFTCPLTGKYRFSGTVYLTGLGSAHDQILIEVVTSNRTYSAYYEQVSTQSKTAANIPWTILADMDAADTAFVRVTVSGSTKTVNVYGDATTATHFAGELV